MALAVTFAICLASLSVLIQFGPTSAQQGAVAEVSVIDFAFDPGTTTVPAGTTVTWTNNGNRPHTVTAADGSFDSGRLDPGEQFSQAFDRPGTYSYQCGFHPEMQGTIVVTEAQSGQGADDGGIEVAVADEGQAAVSSPTPAPDASGSGGAQDGAQDLAPIENSRLAHVHAGNCEELGIVVYSLPDIRTYRIDEGGADGVGAIELIAGTANVPITGLFGEPFSIHIHESAQNKQRYLACADVGSQPAAPWSEADGLVLEAREQNNSGYSGFVSVQPTLAGGAAIAVSIAASPDSIDAAAAQAAPAPSASYTSENFGYTIGYGQIWQESENSSTANRDRFVLFNGSSYITFTGAAAYNGDPQACVDAFVSQLTADPNVSNLRLSVDEDGNPAQGGTDATGAYAIYDHDYTFPNRVEPYTLFVGCVPLVPDEAVLAIVQNVPTADYNEQVELREALLRGLTLAQ